MILEASVPWHRNLRQLIANEQIASRFHQEHKFLRAVTKSFSSVIRQIASKIDTRSNDSFSMGELSDVKSTRSKRQDFSFEYALPHISTAASEMSVPTTSFAPSSNQNGTKAPLPHAASKTDIPATLILDAFRTSRTRRNFAW